MTMRIARLTTECRLPRGQEAAGALVDRAVRDLLPRALAERLGPSLDRHPAICRLKGLTVDLQIDLETLRRGGLADAWAAAVARSLHKALARPDDGGRLRRHDSWAGYVAAAIGDILAGRPIPDWAVPELAVRADRPAAILVLDLLLDAGPGMGDVLAVLRVAGTLGPAVGLLDEVGLERLLRAVAEAEARPADLTAAQVVELAQAMARRGLAPTSGDAVSRRQAIMLWLDLDRALPLRGVWLGGLLLLRLLQRPELREDADARLGDMPAWCEAARQALAKAPPQFGEALDALRAITPQAAGRDHDARWRETDGAGVLLLYGALQRLGWSRALRKAGAPMRVVQALIVGCAMRLLRPGWTPEAAIEPAAALLAGMTGQVDRHGVAEIFETQPPSPPGIVAADWPDLVDQAAGALARAFAGRLRGFRDAEPEVVARHFLRRPGRVRLAEDELSVVLSPSPWAVVLHVAGADEPLEGLDWSPFRRVSFALEGL
jgi:hypothetical protein